MMSDKKVQTKKSTKWQPGQRLVFSEAFKPEKVAQITSVQISLAQFSKLWGVSPKSVYRWIYQYSSEHQKESEATKVQELQAQVAALEQALGQKQ